MCIPDVTQDAVLLIDVGGTLVVYLNDAVTQVVNLNYRSDLGGVCFVRKSIRQSPKGFLLALTGYGDADMINLRNEDGRAIPPPAAARIPVGQTIARQAEVYGVKYF